MMMVFISARTLYSMDIPFMTGMASLITIHFDGDILKATLFEQVSDRLFTDLHMFDMLQTNMNNSIFL